MLLLITSNECLASWLINFITGKWFYCQSRNIRSSVCFPPLDHIAAGNKCLKPSGSYIHAKDKRGHCWSCWCLRDVITNQESVKQQRKPILMSHKKHGAPPLAENGEKRTPPAKQPNQKKVLNIPFFLDWLLIYKNWLNVNPTYSFCQKTGHQLMKE